MVGVLAFHGTNFSHDVKKTLVSQVAVLGGGESSKHDPAFDCSSHVLLLLFVSKTIAITSLPHLSLLVS